MGFIETLRQQKEADAQARNQREAELSRKRKIEDETRQQRETQEREYHQQRKQQAHAHFQESQAESLVTALAEVVQGHCRGYPTSGRYDSVWTSKIDQSQGQLPSLAKDSDSVSFGIIWDQVKNRSRSAPIPLGDHAREHGSMKKWDELEAKFIEVETQPDGDIIFHANRDIKVPVQKWKSNNTLIEDALEQAYNNPRHQRYNGNFYSYHPDSGG